MIINANAPARKHFYTLSKLLPEYALAQHRNERYNILVNQGVTEFRTSCDDTTLYRNWDNMTVLEFTNHYNIELPQYWQIKS
jgi:hypothetical protein